MTPVRLCLLDASGTLLGANQAWLDLAVPTPPTVASPGGEASDADTGGVSGAGTTTLHQESLQGLLQVVRNGLPEVALEYSGPSPEGQRWFELRALRLPGGAGAAYLVTHRDVTEQRRTETALRASAERFQVALKAAPIVVFNQDRDLRYTWLGNPALGLTEAEALGRTDEEILGEDVARPLTVTKRRVLTTGVGERQEVLVARAGMSAWYDLTVEPLRNARGDVAGITSVALDITERKEAEAARGASETRYRELFDHLTSGVAVYSAVDDGRDFVFVDINRAGERIDRDSREQLIGRRLTEVRPGVADFGLLDALRRVWRTGIAEHFPVRLYQDHRLQEWYENHLYQLPSGEVVALFNNVTEEKQREAALRESEVLRHQAAESAPDALCAIDREYRLLFNNQRHRRLVAAGGGQPPGIGECVLSPTTPPAVRDRWRAAYDRSLRGEAFCFETEWRDTGGNAQVFENHLSPLRDANGATIGVLVVAHDVTERKLAEETLRASREQLRTLAGRLQSVREEERTAVAREIHDVLAQELTRLKMDIAWLQRRTARPLPPEQQPALSERLRVMSDVADAAIDSVQRIATGLRPVVLDTLGLAAAVEWAGREFQDRTGVLCRTIVADADLPVDRERATAAFRILQESLTNIARHAGATEVEIRLGCEQAEAPGTGGSPTRKLALDVRDNGRGISATQLGDPRSLGLLGMRERAGLLGGRCEIVGHPEGGTIVELRMPLSPGP